MAPRYTKTLAVVGLSIKKAGAADPSLAVTKDGLHWLWNDSKPGSIATFWRECTSGMMHIAAAVYGYYTIEDTDLHDRMTAGKRAAQCQLALDAAKAQGLRVNDFDGVLFVVAGIATIDGGKSAAISEDVAIPVAIFDQQGRHDFIAHETGHVLGLEHPFRQSFTGYLNGEYGDPTCIMSAMTYGRLPVTRALPADATSGVSIMSNFWNNAGPSVSPATLWRYCPEYPQAPEWVKLLPANPSPTQVTLCAPFTTRTGTRLAVIPTGATGPMPSYYTLEYRPAKGWDGVLSTSPGSADDANCAGVVVHKILDIGNSSQYGFPVLQAVEYVTTVPTPSAGDDDWNNSTFGVRVVEGSESESEGVITVEIAAVLPDTVSARMVVDVEKRTQTRRPGGVTAVSMMGPSCGTRQYDTEVVDTYTRVRVTSGSSGLDDPTFSYAVNGVAVPGSAQLSSLPTSGNINADVMVDVATGYRTSERRTERLALPYTLTGNVLELDVQAGLGVVTFDITLTATAGGRSASVTENAQVVTRTYELPAQAEVDRASCLKPIKDALQDATVRVGGVDIVHGVDWSAMSREQLGESLLTVHRLARTRPWQARELLERAAERLGVSAQDLMSVADHLAVF